MPERVQIGAFFDGARIRVSGEIPAGRSAVVEVMGKRLEEQLLRKGRHWDIWMNVGEIDIEDAPNLYVVLSTDPSDLSRADTDAEFGYSALERQVSFVGDVQGLTRPEIFRRFVALKESEKLYVQLPGALKLTGASGDLSIVEGTFRIPSRVAPGDYQVRLSVVEHGRIMHSESARLAVRMVGLPAFLASLAREHGALHGLLAILIAVLFGFLVGVVFRRKRRASGPA
jgi:hypothetical protein